VGVDLRSFLNDEAREDRHQGGAPGGHAAYLNKCHVHLQERSNTAANSPIWDYRSNGNLYPAVDSRLFV
jgi:hypothetical protein